MVDPAHDAERSIESPLGVFLLKDPSVIERLPADQGKRLDDLIEANGLEPLLFHNLEAMGAEVASRRQAAWKMSRVCSSARTTSYRAALDEVVEVCTSLDIAVRLLRGTQVAFYLCVEPELRPVTQLEIQVPPHQARETYDALKARGFSELDDLSKVQASGEHHLPPLVREGVTITIYRRSCAPLADYADDPFPMRQAPVENNPEVLRGEPLLTLLILEIFEQSFCRALATLLDLHRVITGLRIDWSVVLDIADRLGVERQFFCILSLVQEFFNSPIDATFLARLEEHPRITPDFPTQALSLVRGLVLQYPVPLEKVREAQACFRESEVAHVSEAARETQVLPQLTRRYRR